MTLGCGYKVCVTMALTSVVMVHVSTVRSPIARLMMKMLTRLLTLCCRPHVSTTMMTTLPSNVTTMSGTSVDMRCTTSGDHAWPRRRHQCLLTPTGSRTSNSLGI